MLLLLPNTGTNVTNKEEEAHQLTVQLLVQGLDLARLLDQADLVSVDAAGVLAGPVHRDACERDGAQATLTPLSRRHKGSG